MKTLQRDSILGVMTEFVEILGHVDSPDGGGGQIRMYVSQVPPVKVWAAIEDRSTKESLSYAQVAASDRVTFRIHYRPGVDHSTRFLWNGRQYLVTGVSDPYQQRRWLIVDLELFAGQ